MKMRTFFTLSVLAALAGCSHAHSDREWADQTRRAQEQTVTNIWLVQSVRDTAAANGIISQHTLYPHHFVTDGAELNDLGRHDVAILAEHYKATVGDLNIRRGTASVALYDARVKHVVEALTDAGVDSSRVRPADELPGGPGMSSEHVVSILEAAKAQAAGGSAGTVTPSNASESAGGGSSKGMKQ